MSKTDSHHIKQTRTGVRKRLASKHINSVLEKMVILPRSECEVLSLNVDWFDKNPIDLTGDKNGIGLNLGEPVFIKPLDGSAPVNHEVFTEDTHPFIDQDTPVDLEPAFLGVTLDVRLDTDA